MNQASQAAYLSKLSNEAIISDDTIKKQCWNSTFKGQSIGEKESERVLWYKKAFLKEFGSDKYLKMKNYFFVRSK